MVDEFGTVPNGAWGEVRARDSPSGGAFAGHRPNSPRLACGRVAPWLRWPE